MAKIIELNDLAYTYLPGSPYEECALKGITYSVEQGEFLGIFGPNGSGKSTLARQLNGLLCPTSGSVNVCGLDTREKESRNELWRRVGLVFQYPEKQIFNTSVYEEVAYGPKNLDLSETEIKNRVYAALYMVGLIPEIIEHSAPLILSGGIKRRVAIAGMLALQPEVLILDEPMAGLDPVGKQSVIDIIKNRRKNKETTIMISHNLKEILALADKIAILDRGNLVFFGNDNELQENTQILNQYRYELPDYLQVVSLLTAKGFKVPRTVTNLMKQDKR